MKKYKAFFSNTKVNARPDENGNTPTKNLGHIIFFHFEDSKVNALSKAYMMASPEQQVADKVELVEM